jgi:ATP-dependent Clp protease ATP-binding subunit ClpC
MADRFDTFTERVPKVLQLAQEEAQRFNHNYIGTERLVREGEGVAAAVLGSLGATVARTRDEVLLLLGASNPPACPDQEGRRRARAERRR